MRTGGALLTCPPTVTLTRFAAGELGEDELAAIGVHLDDCVHCRAVLDVLPDEIGSTSLPMLLDSSPPDSVLRRAFDLVHLVPAPSGDDPEPEPDPSLRFGRFRVVGRLGGGAMGIVYDAEDERLGRRVAVKVLRPAFALHPRARERFLREARAIAALRHPNVVSILEVGEADAGPYLVMELLEGESLGSRLRRKGVLPASEVVRIGRDVAAGLAAAHAGGLIHRDVTPDNIWLTTGGPAKLLDFGLVRAAEGDAAETAPGTIVGTPRYMAPEQARAEAIDSRADLFGLGTVLYHAATGTLPFPGHDTLAVLSSLALHTPAPADRANPAVPRRLAALISRMMSKRPADRPPSAEHVVAALVDSFTPPPWKFRRAIVPLLLLLLAAFGIWWTFQRKDPPAVAIDDPPPVAIHDELPPVPDDPDRAAAQWALSLQGYAHVSILHDGVMLEVTNAPKGGKSWVDRSVDLPKGPFQVVHLNLNRNPVVTDKGLAACRGLKHLTQLQISNSKLTDAGLLHFRECKKLQVLWLHNTGVTDESLPLIAGFPDLIGVNLPQTRVTEAGVRRLSEALPNCNIAWNGGSLGPGTKKE